MESPVKGFCFSSAGAMGGHGGPQGVVLMDSSGQASDRLGGLW